MLSSTVVLALIITALASSTPVVVTVGVIVGAKHVVGCAVVIVRAGIITSGALARGVRVRVIRPPKKCGLQCESARVQMMRQYVAE